MDGKPKNSLRRNEYHPLKMARLTSTSKGNREEAEFSGWEAFPGDYSAQPPDGTDKRDTTSHKFI